MDARRLAVVTSLAAVIGLTPAAIAQRSTVEIVVPLRPASAAGAGLGWSPKAERVALENVQGVLTGSLHLGPPDAPAIDVALRRSRGAHHFDALAIDCDRDGSFQADESLTTTPKERRGKIWSSFTTVLSLPVTAPDGSKRSLPYPVALWFVEDLAEPDAAPALRWTRQGWMEGHVDSDGETIHVAIAEMVTDGIFDLRDRWAIGATAEQARDRNGFRAIDDHNWRGESAYRITAVHPSGLQVTLQAFDPGTTRAEEMAARDRFAADQSAPRAKAPLSFGHDFEAAEQAAKTGGKRLFIDFETTWCGPCKNMDRLVYTAKAVVDAAAKVVAVKVDGDQRKDLTKRFGVTAYPTMILLDANGAEVRRAVGYQSVAKMRAFFGE